MKKITIAIICSLALTIFLTSCGIDTSLMSNVTNSTTNVVLQQRNYRVEGRVTGKSTNRYFFGIGGLSNKALMQKAKSEMLENAKLEGGSRAVIDITYDTHISIIYPIYFEKQITASGYVIEFTQRGE